MSGQDKQLAVRDGSEIQIRAGGVQLNSVSDLMEWCRIAANSGLAPRDLRSPEAIFIAVQMGTELGLSPMQALQSIAVINGRPSVWGDAALALVKAHPEFVDVIETFENDKEGDGVTAVCEVLRRNKAPVKRKFTVAMAKKAGLWGKAGPWSQYSMRMLQMRARSWAIRDAFPDALKGVGIKEEMQDVPQERRLQQAEVKVILPDEADAEPTAEPVAEDAQPDPATGEFTWEPAK